MIKDKKWYRCISRSGRRGVSLSRAWESPRLLKCVCRIALLLTMIVSATALAQAQSGGPTFAEPPRLCPKQTTGGRVLDVTLELQLVDYKGADGTSMKVRAYHLDQSGIWEYCDGKSRPIHNPMIPGPTFQLKKGTAGKSDGDKFRLKLVNKLPIEGGGHGTCNPARNFKATDVHPRQDGKCYIEDFPLVQQTWPACFHGDNVTNMHYHGFHISPQPHQDFVLLSLYPEGTPHVTPSESEAVGSYQYALDPIPSDQAEGTHWYHPHKHGSTALQVTNGMAGTFIIKGPFDQWLESQYNGKLEDKVLIIQQLAQKTNFYSDNPPPTLTVQGTNCTTNPSQCTCAAGITFSAPSPTINGQSNPVITMYSGEIQRWRFVNAAIQSGGQLKIGFAKEFQVRQIAQDGVQFAKQNYVSQPLTELAWFVPNQGQQLWLNATLAPGNRADFLMKAPVVTQPTCFSHVQSVIGNIAPEVRGRIEGRNRAARQAASQAPPEPPPLLTVCVEPRPGTPPMEFPDPAQWPDMPPFLQNIPPPVITDTVAFSMHGTSTNDPKNNFFINNVQYCPECANHTLTLKIAEEWTLTNDSAPQHPFHIHTNPHQLVEQGSLIKGQPIAFQKYDPPLWEDTIALPNQGMCWNIQAGPIFNNDEAQQKCPQACTKANADLQWKGNWVTTNPGTMSVCNCCTPSDSTGYVKIRQLPTDFTGEFVLHCHILGHEDRGMMQNVQVVCPPPNQTSFGKPRPEQPECVEGNYIPAAKKCPPHYATGDKCAL